MRDEIWITEEGRSLFGWGKMEAVNFEKFIATLHADDREPTRQAVRRSLEGRGDYEAEYRVSLVDGATRWISARGRVEFNGDRTSLFLAFQSRDKHFIDVVVECGRNRRKTRLFYVALRQCCFTLIKEFAIWVVGYRSIIQRSH